MASPAAEYMISGMMLLVGAATFVCSRSPRIGILLRPLSWSLSLFGLGIWSLFGSPLAGIQSYVVPLAMTLSILWGIRSERLPVPIAARKLGARFVSIGFLILLGISSDLIVLFFVSEAAMLSTLAEYSWDSPLPETRRKLLARTLGSLFLLSAGVMLIASFAGTSSLELIETQLTDRWERAGSLMQDAHQGSEILQVGLVFLLTGAAWRLSFFPFTLSWAGEECESQVVRVFSISVFLAVVIPRIIGGFEVSQILLITFGLSTFARGTIRAIRTEFLDDSLRALLISSAALIWIMLAIALQGSSTGEATTEGSRFTGETILIFELECALVAFVLLGIAIDRDSAGEGPSARSERLTGMLQRVPVSAFLTMFLILLWTGVFAIRGRWAMLFEGFQIASSNRTAAGGYFLVSTVVMLCFCLQQFFAIQLCQIICTRGWSFRAGFSKREPHSDSSYSLPRQAVMPSSFDD